MQRAVGEGISPAAWHEQAQQRDKQDTSFPTGSLRAGSTSMAERDPQHTGDGELWNRAASQPVTKHDQLLTACLQHPGDFVHFATIASEPGANQTPRVL